MPLKEIQKTVNSMMVMCTYACQFACTYCEIKQSRSSMPLETFRKAIGLILTTQDKECQLRFWGGEPLLRWDFIKEGISLAEKRAKEKGKKIKFMITTNGLLLDAQKIKFLKDHPVEIMFSLDGDIDTNKIHRLHRSGVELENRLITNLRLLIKSGLPYFVNMVVTATTVNNLARNLVFLKELETKRVQLCYQCGIYWPKPRTEKLVNELKKFVKEYNNYAFLMNFRNSCEPTMLSQEIVVDTDGKVYFDAAIFMEKKFTRLRKSYFLGEIDKIECIDSLYNSKSNLYYIFKKICSKEIEKRVFSNNIDLGLKLDNFFRSLSGESINSNENPQLIPIIKGDLSSQKKVLNRLGMNSLFLYVDGPCLNNCIFCKHKDENFTDLFKIEIKLKSNLKLKARKLCIIGNDPLLHPEIKEIVKLAKKYGFVEIEIMTSGESLFDKKFSRDLIDAGVSSLSLPLFSRKERIHDLIVGANGSFANVIKGIRNVSNYKVKVFIHTNLIKQNIDDLFSLEEFVRKDLRLPFVILPIRSKTANLAFRNLMPSYGEITGKMQGIHSLLGFPICIVRKVQKKLFKDDTEISESMKLYLLDQKFFKLNLCKCCFYFHKCVGLFKEYCYIYPLEEIAPFKKNRENMPIN